MFDISKSKAIRVMKVDSPWASIRLWDGTELRMRLVVEEVLRGYEPDGITPSIHPDGQPVYLIKSHNEVKINKSQAVIGGNNVN